MKYLSIAQIREALSQLKPHHPVFAVSFFTMKKANAPVGGKERISLDALDAEFLREHYRVHSKSDYFLRVMRKGQPRKEWNKPEYAGKGLQSVNTRGCPGVFLHDRNDNTWGWTRDYVTALARLLPGGVKMPLLHIAVWFYKYQPWPDNATRKDVIKQIIRDYSLTDDELSNLFERGVISPLEETDAFQAVPCKWYEILHGFSRPADVPPDTGGMLTYLEVDSIGPMRHLRIEPARRLSILTGDNALGKTFLLDLAWWALTRDWADQSAWPSVSTGRTPIIKFAVSSAQQSPVLKAKLEASTGEWQVPDPTSAISGLVVYARVDGSFAVWDPVNRNLQGQGARQGWPGAKFTREEVWNGSPGRIEGLVRDWVRWHERQDKYPVFSTFKAVLKRVSPPDLGPLEPGEPVRLPREIREIPTLVHPYGTIPIVFASAGIKRIITLAYLIVWAWEEHKIQAKQAGRKEERQMVVIVDEVEAHLHPKWQRIILPALLGIARDLSQELSMQMLVATHSPLVLASSEPVFDNNLDRLYHLEMMSDGRVTLAELPFELRGSADSWLASQVFDIAHPGSREREDAIKAASSLQESAHVTRKDVERVTAKLKQHLPPEDLFWVRWVFFAEKHGVSM